MMLQQASLNSFVQTNSHGDISWFTTLKLSLKECVVQATLFTASAYYIFNAEIMKS